MITTTAVGAGVGVTVMTTIEAAMDPSVPMVPGGTMEPVTVHGGVKRARIIFSGTRRVVYEG